MNPTDRDLFHEEQSMPTMSFGDHIEELRIRLVLALIGLFAGLLITCVPIPIGGGQWFYLGKWVMRSMQEPAKEALTRYNADLAQRRAQEADATQAKTEPFRVEVPAGQFVDAVSRYFPALDRPPAEALKDQTVTLETVYSQSSWIKTVNLTAERRSALISTTPMESFMVLFLVCIVTGLVLASPWVLYQFWAFVAAGLYRHERQYLMKYLPFSVMLFLGGVFLCFFYVLPFTLAFLLDFNAWLDIEPMLKISEWISFATILPLIFGVCFQTPLVMLLLERVGIFTVEAYREKRRMALLAIVVGAAALTPTGDPFTMMLLAGPMYALYELGIRLIPARKDEDVAAAT